MKGGKRSFWSAVYKYKVHHILFWIGYFVFWTLSYKKIYPLEFLLFTTTVYFVFNATAFYTTAYYLFPRFLYTNKYGLFFLWFAVLMLSLSTGLTLSLYFIFKDIHAEIGENIFALFQYSCLAIVMMVGLMAGAKLIIEKIASQRATRHLDKQRLESELQYLRAQVNPHFLFNAINSIYFLIKKDPDQAAETLIKLSDLLRFQLYDCSDEKIDIEKEIEYLNNFIALEQIRKGEKVKVDFSIQGNLAGFQIAPFLLIPFLENSFKHVSNFTNKGNHVTINLNREANIFTATFKNSTDVITRNGVGGIGLKNVKRRLELIYPNRHQLKIQEKDGHYSVNLSLTI